MRNPRVALRSSAASPGRTPSHGHRTGNNYLRTPQHTPEPADWAAYFTSGATRRAAAQAGLPNAVTEQEAADLVREAEVFLGLDDFHTRLGLGKADVGRDGRLTTQAVFTVFTNIGQV
jgi:hypothetical protein